MSQLDKLKEKRKNNLDSLAKAAESMEAKSYKDEAEWQPTVDKSGNGYAVIRFLPEHENMDLPWVRYWDHGFKGSTGKWYFEKSLTTLGQDDPVSEHNTKLWNSGIESDKDVVRGTTNAPGRKRKLHYVSNILVLHDSGNKENEGKVFKYKYGKKIFDKINSAMKPQFEDETPINPFDLWDGADFKLKIRQVEGQRNYDSSVFSDPSPLFDGDEEKLEWVLSQLYDLTEYVAPESFKSYDELNRKFLSVIGESEAKENVSSSMQERLKQTENSKYESVPEPKTEKKDYSEETDENDDTLDYFRKLAEEE